MPELKAYYFARKCSRCGDIHGSLFPGLEEEETQARLDSIQYAQEKNEPYVCQELPFKAEIKDREEDSFLSFLQAIFDPGSLN